MLWLLVDHLIFNLSFRLQVQLGPRYEASCVLSRVGVKYSTCTWYLNLSTHLSVLDVLEYLVYGNIEILVLVLVLDQKYLVLSK